MLDALLNTPIAHRGLFNNSAGIPENSMLAFQMAIIKGYPIEFDVRMTHDGRLVVFHDASLRRMTGEKGTLYGLSASGLQKVRLLGTDQRIPYLEDLLDMNAGRVPLLIEVKSRRRPGRLEQKLLNMLIGYRGEYAVESFNPLSVKWFKENAPGILRGQLSGAVGGGRLLYKRALLRGALFHRLNKPDFIAYDIRYLPARSVARLREKGFPIIGYTAKSKLEYERALQYCDSVIFEGFEP